eukprot:Plantae.Rhodophyta-Hildenbrandia_rubra.ctg6418.p1 GENE.Plantae.Rhodophyta-Hildenbrandia_rubra.ctg6418~~Plantae.Rhodophyta-Hildenbrandia_rubra.ctg6418.p1  ORF type:complete len:259 (-),score=48.52 Plantae.Rhodophyta-Hildenbrandia_rubra.ctg6418:217-993(-)
MASNNKGTQQSSSEGVAAAREAIQQFKSTESDELDLQQLGLTDNDWGNISSDFVAVAAKVKTLNLFMNELTKLPKEIGECTNLERLLAGCNPLRMVEDQLFDGLRNLKELDVGYGETLETLPDTIGQLGMLEKLLVGNCRLQELPNGLFRCEALQEIHGYGNCLKEIPAGIGKLKSLTLLNIGRNQIDKLPDAVAQLPSLEKLFVYENNLERLPKQVGNLPQLKAVNVDGNTILPSLPKDVRRSGDAKQIAAFYASLG